MTGFLDTHQMCKNVSWYDYGMDYHYEEKFNARKVSQLKKLTAFIALNANFNEFQLVWANSIS